MLKLLFTGLILYAAYKIFFGPNAIERGQQGDRGHIHYEDDLKQSRKADEDDYIDYEEVD